MVDVHRFSYLSKNIKGLNMIKLPIQGWPRNLEMQDEAPKIALNCLFSAAEFCRYNYI